MTNTRTWQEKWFCRLMDWHLSPRAITTDGFQASGDCPRCGVRVLLDSQGNWFGTQAQKRTNHPVSSEEVENDG